MLNFFRMILKTINPDRSASPRLPSCLAKLFGKEDVWLIMFEPDKAKIPDGCNFIIWFESERSSEDLLKAFESKGWQAQVGYSGFTLTQIVPIRDMRTGRTKNRQINKAALVTAKPSCLRVLAGNCTYPESIGAEFRKLILRLEGQSNNLFCLYVRGSALCREVPASAELLGMDSNSLSDADSAVLHTGYIVQIDDAPASCSPVNLLQRKVELISPSVVVDEEGYTHIKCWPYPGRRLWNQVRMVELYPAWGPNFMFVHNYVRIAGDNFEDFIHMDSEGLQEFINHLNVLPGFSKKDFDAARKRLFDDEEVVWIRSDDA